MLFFTYGPHLWFDTRRTLTHLCSAADLSELVVMKFDILPTKQLFSMPVEITHKMKTKTFIFKAECEFCRIQ
jgi:hypothetical protein